jgi:hypothetical protein
MAVATPSGWYCHICREWAEQCFFGRVEPSICHPCNKFLLTYPSEVSVAEFVRDKREDVDVEMLLKLVAKRRTDRHGARLAKLRRRREGQKVRVQRDIGWFKIERARALCGQVRLIRELDAKRDALRKAIADADEQIGSSKRVLKALGLRCESASLE